jgi:2,3-dihydroxy-p-cumate/2,3-dihydroxybenzoate 3,4-dioxygenase
LHLWRALGAEVVDYVGDIAYLALDEAHHRVALYPSRERGVLYVAFEVASLDDVMRGRYFLAERQVRLVQGPGRQPVSQQAFVLFRGPDDLIYGYVAGMAPRPPNSAPPRQFALSAESLCAWGSRAVDVAELSPGPGDAP